MLFAILLEHASITKAEGLVLDGFRTFRAGKIESTPVYAVHELMPEAVGSSLSSTPGHAGRVSTPARGGHKEPGPREISVRCNFSPADGGESAGSTVRQNAVRLVPRGRG